MSDKMKNFVVRALTGIVYVVLLVGCTVYSPLTAFLFFSLVSFASVFEFCTIMNKHNGCQLSRSITAMAGVCLGAAIWVMCVGGEGSAKMMALYGFLLVFIIVKELFRTDGQPMMNWAMAFASQIYVALPFALLPLLCVSIDGERPVYMWIYPLAMFIFLWTSDTGAYLCGSTLSRFFPAKLFPRISPNKSWVGSIGGGLLTVGASAIIWSLTPDTMALWKWIGFALVVVVFGTLGDLVESSLKRQLGIKDSGNILPGHGGMLDRFDSCVLAIPAVVIYFLLINDIA